MIERKKTKIVATLGPSTDTPQIIEKMILEGVDVFRINFSHADHSEVKNRIKMIREISEKTQTNTSIFFDSAFVTDTPTPCKPPENAYADSILFSNFPPECNLV